MTLCFFLTGGNSLKVWDDLGILEREISLYKLLVEHGFTVDIISYGTDESKYLDKWNKISIHYNRQSLPHDMYERYLPIIHEGVFRNANLIKTNQVGGAAIVLEVAELFQKPLIARCGYLPSLMNPDRYDTEDLERRLFHRANIVVVSSNEVVQVLRTWNITKEKIQQIPNYIPSHFFTIKRPAIIKKRICYTGRFDESQKNLLALIAATAGLDIELLFIGSGENKILEQAAQQHNVNLTLLDRVPNEQLPQYISASMIYVLPSHFEGHPKSLIEAMATGTPCIGTDVQGIRECIKDGSTGLLAKDCSAGALRTKILCLLKDEDLRLSLGQAGKEYAQNNYSLTVILAKELNIYRDIDKLARVRVREESLSELRQNYSGALLKLQKMQRQERKERLNKFMSPKKITKAAAKRLLAKIPPRYIRKLQAYINYCYPETAPSAFAGIRAKADAMSVENALRFLLDLDNKLYSYTGIKSIEYNSGLDSKHKHMRYYDFFTKHISSGQRVLDIGCGNGALAFHLTEATDAYITGIELSADNIHIAKERFSHERLEYVCADALTYISQESFQVIIMSNVLEYLPKRSQFLSKLFERYEPKYLLLRVPIFQRDWRVPLKKELNIEYRLDPAHEIEYLPEELEQELNEAGLKLTQAEYRWGEVWGILVRR